jgi:hypothetical protein
MSKTLAELLDEKAYKASQGPWIPGGGGTELPFLTKSGHRLQYMWQPTTGKHAYINLDTDMILTDEEAYNRINW